MSQCLNCGGEIVAGRPHQRAGGNFVCPPRMEEAPGEPGETRAAVGHSGVDDLLPPCLGSEEEEGRFMEFWLKSGPELDEYKYSTRALARAVWCAAKRDCVK